VKVAVLLVLAAGLAPACEPPSVASTFVVVDDAYPAQSGYVVYRAFWQAVSFTAPIPPGSSSDPQSTVPASANTAYVLVAPGWDPASGTSPTTFFVLQSRQGYGAHVNDTAHIPVSDASFAGDCAAGSPLTQAQADFVTQYVFPDVFGGFAYDAATCTTTALGDGAAGAD
jgi:hypothetical protein